MDKLTIYKNKPEIFKCELQIEGALLENTVVKLCLEFEDNKNLYFYGELDKDGVCSIPVPKLTEVSKNKCKMLIEAIADDIYFKVYEAEVDLKNSVDVKMKSKMDTTTIKQNEAVVKIGRTWQENKIVKNDVDMVFEEPECPPVIDKEDKTPTSINPFLPLRMSTFNDWKKGQ